MQSLLPFALRGRSASQSAAQGTLPSFFAQQPPSLPSLPSTNLAAAGTGFSPAQPFAQQALGSGFGQAPALGMGMDGFGFAFADAPMLPTLKEKDADPNAVGVLGALADEKPRHHHHHHRKLEGFEMLPEILLATPALPRGAFLVQLNLGNGAIPVVVVNDPKLLEALQQPPALPALVNAFAAAQ
jgi:hypothetical protein